SGAGRQSEAAPSQGALGVPRPDPFLLPPRFLPIKDFGLSGISGSSPSPSGPALGEIAVRSGLPALGSPWRVDLISLDPEAGSRLAGPRGGLRRHLARPRSHRLHPSCGVWRAAPPRPAVPPRIVYPAAKHTDPDGRLDLLPAGPALQMAPRRQPPTDWRGFI